MCPIYIERNRTLSVLFYRVMRIVGIDFVRRALRTLRRWGRYTLAKSIVQLSQSNRRAAERKKRSNSFQIMLRRTERIAQFSTQRLAHNFPPGRNCDASKVHYSFAMQSNFHRFRATTKSLFRVLCRGLYGLLKGSAICSTGRGGRFMGQRTVNRAKNCDQMQCVRAIMRLSRRVDATRNTYRQLGEHTKTNDGTLFGGYATDRLDETGRGAQALA